jgi:8-oxo-dGTP pyrophosphatase MutT (NUDIX family)
VPRQRRDLVARLVLMRTGAAGEPELLAARHRHDDGSQFWCLPGGKLEPGERFDQAARRELREEAGIEPELDGVVWVQDLPRLDRLELIFAARAPGAALADLSPGDRHLVGLAWRRLADLADDDFRPADLLATLRRARLPAVPYVTEAPGSGSPDG